ncbi:hypothetical protein E2C01_047713 [Portunus trituberculatus]|uniref:Uncharacterized protein n=1 Tax=Portunus trituberculatus TaxID=210409 RepID=A0A5B7G4B9_PORTR|nr:hypothetical protein [Portunus trituberculatus]
MRKGGNPVLDVVLAGRDLNPPLCTREHLFLRDFNIFRDTNPDGPAATLFALLDSRIILGNGRENDTKTITFNN